MGADLIGYLVKGPKTLPKPQRNFARAHAMNLVRAAKEYETASERRRGSLVKTTFKYLSDPDEEIAYLRDHDNEGDDGGAAIDQLIDDLFAWWEEGSRDCASRADPDDRDHTLLFAGEMTWGDEPSGCGYQLLRDTVRLDMWKFFGIR